jgi:parallel beta-helix repeat protein
MFDLQQKSMNHFYLIVALCVLAPTAVTAKSLNLYVATNGNDAWSGTFAGPIASGQDGPLRTAATALGAARRARQNTALSVDGVSIFFCGGRHELAEPIVLLPEDSGTSVERPFTLAAFPGEQPVLSGGRRLTGWKPVSGKAGQWQLGIPEVREGKWYFRQLFVNGHRRQRARTPNSGFYRIQGASPQDKPVQIHFKPGEIKKEWADDGDVEVIALLAWADIRMQIRAVDEPNHIATLSGNPRPSNKENNAQYYIENAPDALDQIGEWYLNRRSGVVTYWAEPGEDPNVDEVIAPRLADLLELRGDFTAQRAVQHLVIRGLTFSHTDWTLGPEGYADTQAAIATRGDLRAEGTVDGVVEDCTFARLAGYAIELGRGCQRIRVIGNEMTDLGGGGIRVGDTNKKPQPFEANHSHVITDNHIHQVGLIYPPAVGVFILQSGTNHIAHNHIHDLYYTAISVGWNWGYQETPCRENIIEFNHLHDIGQGRLSDMGAVYTLGIQQGTVIRHNLIHDVSAFTYGGWGLYTDEGSTGIVLENNVVYRCKSAGFHQQYGRDNIVRNNIFAFNREVQLMRTRAEPHTSFVFTNNIVCFDSGLLLGSNWANDNYVMERNVYWDTRLGTAGNLKFSNASWEQWRARGHDTNSVIADPLFVAPDKFDLRLKPESPARQLGFRPIDLSTVGVRAKAQRASVVK